MTAGAHTLVVDSRRERQRAMLAAVLLTARHVIADANHVVVFRRQIAIRIHAGPCTVLGNITTGPIEFNGALLGPPWDALNA
jgi:hypothetical protein